MGIVVLRTKNGEYFDTWTTFQYTVQRSGQMEKLGTIGQLQ